jgi:hypothetical protein
MYQDGLIQSDFLGGKPNFFSCAEEERRRATALGDASRSRRIAGVLVGFGVGVASHETKIRDYILVSPSLTFVEFLYKERCLISKPLCVNHLNKTARSKRKGRVETLYSFAFWI